MFKPITWFPISTLPCDYLTKHPHTADNTSQVDLFEREFQCFGGDQEWLKGLDNAPKKIQNLVPINNILCHKPWALTEQHLQVRYQGERLKYIRTVFLNGTQDFP